MDFPSFVQTRSQKRANSLKENLNVSYDIVVHDDIPSGNEKNDDKMTIEELLTDLRSKLATCQFLNDKMNEENQKLKTTIKTQEDKLQSLEEKLHNFLNKEQMVRIGIQTMDFETSTTEAVQNRECTTKMQLNQDTAVEPHTVVNHSSLRLPDCPENMALIDKPDVETGLDNLQRNQEIAGTLNQQILSLPRRSTEGKSSYHEQVGSRVLIIADEIGRKMAKILGEKLPSLFEVSSMIKPSGSFAYLTQNIERLTKNLTKRDHVVVLISSRHAEENNLQYLERKIHDLISRLNNTKLLMATIPYKFNESYDFYLNDVIKQINMKIEKQLFNYPHKTCVYTNKVLFGQDYTKKGFMKQSGKERLADFIAEYIQGKRADDRAIENQIQMKPWEEHDYTPSKSGSTAVEPVNSAARGSKNPKSQLKQRKKTILMKLLKLLL